MHPTQAGGPPIRRLACITWIILCMAALGLAQNTNSGDIRGTVTDSSGSVIPGATVTVINNDTGVVKELVTNEAGIYDTASILPGRYKIIFGKEGFNKVVRDGITLSVGLITIDAQLPVGAVQQQVEIVAEAPILKTETGEQSITLQTQTMSEMPNVGQTWVNFMKLLPGASGAPTASQGASNPGTGISINGNMPYYANFLADGASTTLPHSANVDVSIFESVQEVQVSTSSFSAQYGIGGAVFNQISKSGANQWHGSAYEYFQNNALNARSFFDKKVARQRYDNFGGSVAGPIVKNKVFFYFNLDKIVNPQGATRFVNVPTDAMKRGDFSDPVFPVIYDPSNGRPFEGNKIPSSQWDTVAANIQKDYPAANQPGIQSNYLYMANNVNPFIKEFGRIDYSVSDKNRLTFSITQRDNNAFYDNTSCPLNCQHGDVDSYNAQLSDVHTFSGTTVNEFRFGYTKQGNWFQPTSIGKGYPQQLGLKYAKADIYPNINITGTAGNNVLTPQSNSIYIEHSFEPSDVVTMIRGKHILHFGGEVLAFRDNSTPWGNMVSGSFTFTGIFTKSNVGYADFLLGQVQAWNALLQPMAAARSKHPQAFFQDDIKLRPNLTLNLGLRYEYHGGWSEVNNHAGSFDPTLMNPKTNTPGAVWFAPANGRKQLERSDTKLFLPRVSLAWSPTPNWVVRGGFGQYAYGWSLDGYGAGMGFGSNSTGNKAADVVNPVPVAILSGDGAGLPYLQASRDPGAYNGQGGIPYQPYDTPAARIYQWSFSVQRQLAKDTVLETAYVGSHGYDLSFPVDRNQVPQQNLGQGNAGRPFPQYGALGSNTFNAISNYRALQVSFRKRFTRGLSFDTNYTWSRMMDDQSSSGWGGRGGVQPYQNAYDPSANYGPSNFDVPHMWKGAVVYELPLGKGHSVLNSGGVLDALFGGWQTSAIYIAQSGAPFTVAMSSNNGLGSQAGNWYPDVAGTPSVSNPTIREWFNQLAYKQPADRTYGNSKRNSLRGPGLSDIDFSLGKTFSLPKSERVKLQLRFDAANVLNHPSFGQPNANLNPTALAKQQPDASVGKITAVTVNGRNIQLGARIVF
jgi:hypothetical protein